MRKDLKEKALYLLSEPFHTYGFGHACAEDIESLPQEDRVEFLSFVLERYSLVEPRNTPSRIEHVSSAEALADIFNAIWKEIEIICRATIAVRPKTEEFAKFVLALLAKYESLEEKALIIAYVVERKALLPYVADMPSPKALAPGTATKLVANYPKEIAQIYRLVQELEKYNFSEVASIVLQILPEKDPERSLLLAYFLRSIKVAIEDQFVSGEVPSDEPTDDDSGEGPPPNQSDLN